MNLPLTMGVELNIDLRLRFAVLGINLVTSSNVGTEGLTSGIQTGFLVIGSPPLG